ncbi:MAG: extracellular solute-binding protein [Bacteroidota bacterium]
MPHRLAGLAILLFLSGCASDDRTPLVVYSPHGSDQLEFYEAAFEAANPGVDVQPIDMGAQDAYDRIRTERANPQASVWWGAPQVTFALAAEEGLLQPFTPSFADALPASAKDPEGRWYGTYLTPEGILVNTNTVSEDERPRDWDDLLDPKWRDRILIRSPMQSGTMRAIWSAMIVRQPTVEEGFQWLARLDQNTKAYAADPTQMYLGIGRATADVSLWNMPDTYLQAEENGYPFAFIIPESGTPVLVDGIAIPTGAPQPELAQQFVEFVSSREAMLEQAKDYFRIPARTDLPQDSLPDWVSQAQISAMDLDWSDLAQREQDWMQTWDEQIKGRGAAYLGEQ